MIPQMDYEAAGPGKQARNIRGPDPPHDSKDPVYRRERLARLFRPTWSRPTNTTTNTALIAAFVAVVLLLIVFGGWAMTGPMKNGLAEGSPWIWSLALLAFGFGALLFWVIIKKDLLQSTWEESHIPGAGRIVPRLLPAEANADPLTGSTAENTLSAMSEVQ